MADPVVVPPGVDRDWMLRQGMRARGGSAPALAPAGTPMPVFDPLAFLGSDTPSTPRYGDPAFLARQRERMMGGAGMAAQAPAANLQSLPQDAVEALLGSAQPGPLDALLESGQLDQGVGTAQQAPVSMGPTIYRAAPGTRQFNFNMPPRTNPGVDLSAPGAKERLQDYLGYQQQLIEAMQGAGGDVLNSPQLAAAMQEHSSGWDALNKQMMAEGALSQGQAEQAKAGAEQEKNAWVTSPEYQKQRLQEIMADKGGLSAMAQEEAGIPADPKLLAGELGTSSGHLGTDVQNLMTRGISAAPPGSAPFKALMASHGPAINHVLAGRQPYTFSRVDVPAVQRFLSPQVGVAAKPQPRRVGLPVYRSGEEPRTRVSNAALDNIRRGVQQ